MATDILCTGVSFSYQKNREVLRDICLSVEHGESVGLIGANGVGKSTFLKLIVGLLTGYEGEISVQGQPVIKRNLTDIRKKVGYVFRIQTASSLCLRSMKMWPLGLGIMAVRRRKQSRGSWMP